jgi:uncharacterized short protein YbdD (DUF466 family)
MSAVDLSPVRRVRLAFDRLATLAHVVRRIIGVPDHQRYLEHMRLHHPDAAPLDSVAFARDVLARRYERPGSRCC